MLLSRRPLLAILNHIFKEPIPSAINAPFRITIALREELLQLASLCNLAQTNLRAATDNGVWLVDTSEWGIADVKAEVNAKVARELSRKTIFDKGAS